MDGRSCTKARKFDGCVGAWEAQGCLRQGSEPSSKDGCQRCGDSDREHPSPQGSPTSLLPLLSAGKARHDPPQQPEREEVTAATDAAEGKPLGKCVRRYSLLETPSPHPEAFAAVWGEVWTAVDQRTGSLRRLKKNEGTKDNGLAYHVLREMTISGYLQADDHEGVSSKPARTVRLLDAFIDPILDGSLVYHGAAYLAYEHLRHDIYTYVQEHPPDSAGAQSLSRQLLSAMDHLHSRGIVHGNIKKQTVLCSSEGRLVVGGLCTATVVCPSFSQLDRQSGNSLNTLCTSLDIRAPELWLAPEEVARGFYGPAQDMWSAGVVMAIVIGGCLWNQAGRTLGEGAADEFHDRKTTSFLVCVFAQLGTPVHPHPLAQLPAWCMRPWSLLPKWDRLGWSQAEPRFGRDGVRLLEALTDLDLRRRPSAAEALAHAYLQRSPPGREVIEYYEDPVIQAFCTEGLECWTSVDEECREAGETQDLDMLPASSSEASGGEALAAGGEATCSPALRSPSLGAGVVLCNPGIGRAVQRGPHWKWGEQDGGAGVVGITVADSEETPSGWIRVHWSGGAVNSYRVGAEGAYDLQFYAASPPVVLRSPLTGKVVQRGPDWKWDDQDGGEGRHGITVFGAQAEGWVSVLWADGSSSECRAGAEGACDLRLYDVIQFGRGDPWAPLRRLFDGEEPCQPRFDPWAAVRHRAARHYLARDMAAERREQRLRLGVCQALGKHFPECLRAYIYGFLYRPRCPPLDPFLQAVHLSSGMRAILNDWLLEVAMKYKLQQHVVHYAVGICDRYLAYNADLLRSRYQLLGVAALLAADKAAGADVLEVELMSYLCDRAYTHAEVREMEANLLEVFASACPGWSAYHFLSHYAAEVPLEQEYFHLAHYCLDRSLLSYALSRHSPSLLASGACAVAAEFAAKEAHAAPGRWPFGGLAQACGRSRAEVERVAGELCDVLPSKPTVGASTLVAAWNKFSKADRCQVTALLK